MFVFFFATRCRSYARKTHNPIVASCQPIILLLLSSMSMSVSVVCSWCWTICCFDLDLLDLCCKSFLSDQCISSCLFRVVQITRLRQEGEGDHREQGCQAHPNRRSSSAGLNARCALSRSRLAAIRDDLGLRSGVRVLNRDFALRFADASVAS